MSGSLTESLRQKVALIREKAAIKLAPWIVYDDVKEWHRGE